MPIREMKPVDNFWLNITQGLMSDAQLNPIDPRNPDHPGLEQRFFPRWARSPFSMNDSKTPAGFAEIWTAANHARSLVLFGQIARAVAVQAARLRRQIVQLRITKRPTFESAVR